MTEAPGPQSERVKRYAGAAVGFCVISAVYIAAVLFALMVLVMGDCIPTPAEMDAGKTCTAPADLYFWPGVFATVISFVGIQWAFLRWALRKRT